MEHKIGNFPVETSKKTPLDTILFVNRNGEIVGKITNIKIKEPEMVSVNYHLDKNTTFKSITSLGSIDLKNESSINLDLVFSVANDKVILTIRDKSDNTTQQDITENTLHADLTHLLNRHGIDSNMNLADHTIATKIIDDLQKWHSEKVRLLSQYR